MYSIVLTKAAMLHRDYLNMYDNIIPKSFLDFIDSHRNCEDIAMAYIISEKSQRPPVWTSVTFSDTGSGGISSGTSHFETR
jgi:hypothetical protein